MPQKLQYIKQEQPKFIKQFKERAGLKETTSIEEKRSTKTELDDRSDNEDEKPVVVITTKDQFTNEELEEATNCTKRIKFTKPVKRKSADSGLTATTKKKKSRIQLDEKSVKKNTKAITSRSLLSFGDDEG